MKKNIILIGSIALAILLAVTVVIIVNSNKEKPKNASLTGLVLNAKDSKAIENANVRIDSYETKTDKNGSFLFEGLSSGTYSIFVLADGYKPYEFPNYELKVGINKIDGIMLTQDDSKKPNPKDSAIIPPPPLPGTKMDKKPDFKKFNDYSNCMVTISIGDSSAGMVNVSTYMYNNGITKLQNSQILDKNNPQSSVMFITKDKMISHPSNEMGWIAIPKPGIDPKVGEYGLPDKTPNLYIDTLFKLISDKTSTVNFISKVKKDFGQANKYYVVADVDGNLFDGEVYTALDGQLKDVIVEFSGLLKINGQGDKTFLSISNYKKTPSIDLPQNVKIIDVPKLPDIKPPTPKQNNP
jgi:hypothetical protein